MTFFWWESAVSNNFKTGAINRSANSPLQDSKTLKGIRWATLVPSSLVSFIGIAGSDRRHSIVSARNLLQAAKTEGRAAGTKGWQLAIHQRCEL